MPLRATPLFHGAAAMPLVALLRQRLPGLPTVYGFGSRLQGTARPDSDLDMAVRVPGYVPALQLWQLAGERAVLAGCDVDLLDLRAASTVMQYQIVTTGPRWWAEGGQAAPYEAAILSQETALDTARARLLADIMQRGCVHGR